MKVDIIHSGSSGNCAVIDDLIMIDAGWPYNRPCKHVLLTHHHSDHIKHLDKQNGLCMYATEATANLICEKKFPYMRFHEIKVASGFYIHEGNVTYLIVPWAVNHDAPCVGYDITKETDTISDRIFFATDFNEIVAESMFVRNLRNKVWDALYIECNNTLRDSDFVDVFFYEDKKPKDEFHRRKSYENHCNARYLTSLFKKAGYVDLDTRFKEPVHLLHKSSFYYNKNIDMLVELAKVANVQNLYY